MKTLATTLPGLIVMEPAIHGDSRGWFQETYRQNVLAEMGITHDFVQDNQSRSARGVLRGLHFQTGDFAQAKLVRVLQGEVLDVAVDLRQNSPTFGQHFSILLSESNKKQLFIPRGFAHGFLTLSETAVFAYKVDNVYSKAHEGGICYNDQELAINWELPNHELLLSEKDTLLPSFQQWKENSNQQ